MPSKARRPSAGAVTGLLIFTLIGIGTHRAMVTMTLSSSSGTLVMLLGPTDGERRAASEAALARHDDGAQVLE